MTTPWRSAMVLLLLSCTPAWAENWPGWRGPRGNGHAEDKNLPLTWSPTQNVRWKVALPEEGNSSPIVWGNRVFLTQQLDKQGTRRALLCFDRADGKVLWQKEIAYKDKEPTHSTNPYCSATPVTDGTRVLAGFGSAGLVCYDFAGKELWRKDFGKMTHIWGNASSPIFYRDLALFWVGPGERQSLVALDKKTGVTVWQHDEPGGHSGLKEDGKDAGGSFWIGSWSTPVIAQVGDHDELILSIPEKVKGFDPATGKELWSCDGLGKLVYTSPVVSPDGLVVALSGYGGPGLAVKAGARGDVTKALRLWELPRSQPQRIGTGVILGDYLYHVSEPGLAQCFDLKTGKDLWNKERITSTTWGSIVAAGERLYVTNTVGETLVLAAKPKLEILAKNRLNERTLASPAVSNGEVFIRTYKHLWCLAETKAN